MAIPFETLVPSGSVILPVNWETRVPTAPRGSPVPMKVLIVAGFAFGLTTGASLMSLTVPVLKLVIDSRFPLGWLVLLSLSLKLRLTLIVVPTSAWVRVYVSPVASTMLLPFRLHWYL